MQSSVLWDLESQTRHGSEKSCWSKSLEGLGIAGKLCLEGLLLTHVSQLIVQWIDYHLERAAERFFTEFFGFLFDNTSACYRSEVDSPNTYHTLSECQVRIWCYWEVLEEARFWQMQSSVLRDPESQTRHGSEKSCWSRSLEGLGTAGKLCLKGLLLTHVSQLIVQQIDYHLERAAERFFTKFFGFLFDNTSACYLMFASLFPTLLPFILLLCYYEYGLVACLFIRSHLLFSALSINQSKIYRAVILF